MKRIITLTIILFSQSGWGFDHNIVKGQWAVYQSNMLSDNYYYFLRFNNDFSGVLVRSLEHEPITRAFKAEDVIKQDGYLEIQLSKYEKAVLSAWKLKSGSGRLTGQIFMYKENGDLFNKLHFPLQLLDDKHEYMSNDAIKELSAKHRYKTIKFARKKHGLGRGKSRRATYL